MTHTAHPDRDDAARKPSQTPSPRHDAKREPARHSEHRIDKTLEDTFPASDPPATGGVTRVDPAKPERRRDDGGTRH